MLFYIFYQQYTNLFNIHKKKNFQHLARYLLRYGTNYNPTIRSTSIQDYSLVNTLSYIHMYSLPILMHKFPMFAK